MSSFYFADLIALLKTKFCAGSRLFSEPPDSVLIRSEQQLFSVGASSLFSVS